MIYEKDKVKQWRGNETNATMHPVMFNYNVCVFIIENICIDGGMTRQMIYHGDCGWELE